MPTLADIFQFLSGQFFGRTFVPQIDLSGQTIVVTGGNTGLGLDCAKHLARLNVSHLILACRNMKKGEAAKNDIIQITHCQDRTDIEVWEVDLDHYSSVLSFTERVRTKLPRLDGFIANAGLELHKFETSEDCERTLTVNVISTYLMTLGILPKLQQTTSRHGVTTTLTLVGSMIHVFGSSDQLQPVKSARDTFESLSDPKTANMDTRYPLSKLIEHLCFRELVAQLRQTAGSDIGQVAVNCVNPGWCKTELARHASEPVLIRFMALIFRRTSEEGSRTLVHGVTAGADSHGKYLSECQEKRMSYWVRSNAGTECQKRLYQELAVRLERLSPGITKFVDSL